jgi:hypothetical protein
LKNLVVAVMDVSHAITLPIYRQHIDAAKEAINERVLEHIGTRKPVQLRGSSDTQNDGIEQCVLMVSYNYNGAIGRQSVRTRNDYSAEKEVNTRPNEWSKHFVDKRVFLSQCLCLNLVNRLKTIRDS